MVVAFLSYLNWRRIHPKAGVNAFVPAKNYLFSECITGNFVRKQTEHLIGLHQDGIPVGHRYGVVRLWVDGGSNRRVVKMFVRPFRLRHKICITVISTCTEHDDQQRNHEKYSERFHGVWYWGNQIRDRFGTAITPLVSRYWLENGSFPG